MKQKEKKKKKVFTGKRFILSLVFLCFAFIFVVGFTDSTNAASSFTQSVDSTTTKGIGVLTEAIGTPVLAAMNVLLYAVFAFFGLLLIIAGVLLDWAINPTNFALIMNMGAIKTIWITVRDFLNLFFIMVLLFSAFCTVFQINKYNIKKILLNLVIMALLVNFSFPIARFIIDAANIPMYFIINNTFPGLSNESGISTLLVSFSKILTSIVPEPKWFTWGEGPMGSQLTIKLIAASIFVFILTISLLIMAILFIIRMIVLAIIIIFSPVGFVASIFPGTSSFASKWWDTLLKQAFWGPIMAFMLYVALKIMEEMQNGQIGASMEKFANDNGGNFSKIIVGGVSMAIPVALIWIGMGSAKQMGAIGADRAQKWATKAVKWAARAPLKYSGVEGAAKKGWKKFQKEGKLLGHKIPLMGSRGREEREDKMAAAVTGGRDAYKAEGRNIRNRRIKERVDELKKLRTSGFDAETNISKNLGANGDEVERMANAIYMNEQKMINSKSRLKLVLDATNHDVDAQEDIIEKLPKNLTKNIIKSGGDLKDIETSLNSRSSVELMDKLDEKIKDENNNRILYEYTTDKLKGMGRTDKQAKEESAKMHFNLSVEKLAKQKNIHNNAFLSTNSEVTTYLKSKTDEYKKSVMASESMSDDGLKAWKMHIM